MKALIINYGVGNLFSISNALRRIGFEAIIDAKPSKDVDLIVFPGVGSFKAVSKYIMTYSNLLNEARDSGVFFLGICLGMQIMFEYGFEGGEMSKGLSWFKGYVDKMNTKAKLPHIGWDKIFFVAFNNDECKFFMEFNNKYMYFMHSYIAYTNEASSICFTCRYGDTEFPAMVMKNRVIGVQFHPEKSSREGLRFLERVREWMRK